MRKHHDGFYTGMLLAEHLTAHLRRLTVGNELFDLLIKQYLSVRIEETLKASDQMEWVRRMNGIRGEWEEQDLY